MKQKAIFLDRDGVINIEKNYLYKIEDFEFIEGVFDALRYVQNLGYQLFIITNQSGIGRGYYTQSDFDVLSFWMVEEFKKQHIDILDVQLCPHAPDENCNCRKPKTGMIDTLCQNYAIDLNNSWLIGDKSSDIQCAINAKISHNIQVQSGHAFDKLQSKADFVIDSIKEISTIIKQ